MLSGVGRGEKHLSHKNPTGRGVTGSSGVNGSRTTSSLYSCIRELLTDVQDLEQNQSDFRYEVTMVRISALGWASNLRNLPEMNFNKLYDYPVVSWEYHHIVLRRTHYRKYHRSCSGWLRKGGNSCSALGRGDLLLLLFLMWYLLLYHILQLKLFPFCSPRCLLVCHLYILSYGKLYNRACRTTWLQPLFLSTHEENCK